MVMNLDFIVRELEYKVNILTLKNGELEKLKVVKESLEATYKYELKREVLTLSLSTPKTGIINNMAIDTVKFRQLKVNRDLAILRYYSMKTSIEDMKSESESLRKILIYLEGEIKVSEGNKKRY